MRRYYFLATIAFIQILISQNSISQNDGRRIDVLYFHATLRCNGCLNIENLTWESVNKVFAKQITDSSVTMQSIDFQKPENEHYQEDYLFDSQTLILSKKIDGKEVKFVNLESIWEYSDDPQKYQDYIEKEINNLLKN